MRLLFLLAAMASLLGLPQVLSAQQSHPGSLGDSFGMYLNAGDTYDLRIESYYFTPGAYITLPDGQRVNTVEEAVISPYHDGSGTVRGTHSRYWAPQTGNYRVDVFSWDNQTGGAPYMMTRHFLHSDRVTPGGGGGGGGSGDPPDIDCANNNGIQQMPGFDDLPCRDN